MKTALVLFAILATAGPALARHRVKSPDLSMRRASTTNMTCAAASGLVARQGEAVLGTGGDTFDRFVRSEFLCPTGLSGRPAFEPTRDNPSCMIGYYCTAMPPWMERD